MADLSPEDRTIETMFQDAVNALRSGDKPRAKELLTLLLKADQNNSTYWVWLSAAVDNTKERIYCLQTALKLDPGNGTAKRGLVLLGALPPDESIQPFSVNRPRAWEEKLLLANEKPKEKGFRAVLKSPVTRLFSVLIIFAGLASAVLFGFVLPRQSTVIPTQTNTPGPSPTFTGTPTIFGATAAPTKSFAGPTPLWMLLPQTYTPTPFYVNTPRALDSRDQFRIALQAYSAGDWDAFITNMELIIPIEPASADIYYYIGEAYRFQGQASNALKAYNDALKIDPDFGPPYLGLARARLLAEPNLNVEDLFDEAIARDPNFGEVYLERARYFILHNDPKSAIVDLEQADRLMPNSADVYMAYANAYLALDNKESALEAAEKAYSLDITVIPVYKLLGDLYIENGQYSKAVEALEVYVLYNDTDSLSLAMLGQAYFEIGDFKSALLNLDKAMTLNRTGLNRYYYYRGLANLELKNIDQAVSDLELALEADKTSFDINLGLVRGYYIQEKFGSAFLKVEVLNSLAETDQQVALMYYWRALIQEQRGEVKDALKNWKALYAMKADAMTTEMRADAELHLRTIITPTNTPKVSPTPSRTPTRMPTNVVTP
ncbi:MAG: tetratricopeptide repeat protein [Chloroflexi bacterium]|nr:tetratricopeptide repeat protein [Chloroflexota bacterium]